MTRTARNLGRWGAAALGLSLLVVAPMAVGQGRGGGGGGTLVFVNRRPPREVPRNFNPRAWANGSHVTSYEEDTAAHTWRVSFMAFLPRPPNVASVTIAWFHVERDGVRRYISNEDISLSNPGERVFFHSTSLHRAAGEFEPLERYEAVLTANDARGARNLARGSIQLNGQVERHSGVVDFTGAAPTVH